MLLLPHAWTTVILCIWVFLIITCLTPDGAKWGCKAADGDRRIQSSNPHFSLTSLASDPF